MFIKKFLPILVCLLSIACNSLFSQSLKLSYKAHAVKADSVYTTTCKASKSIIDSVSITNISDYTIQVLVKKVIIDTVPGTKVFFCWGTFCYPPEVYTPEDSVTLYSAGVFNKFIPEYNPKGKVGSSTVTYVFFDKYNVNDSSSITFKYISTDDAGIKDLNSDLSVSCYPVPSNNSFNVDYNITEKRIAGYEIAIFNLAGQKMISSTLNTNSGRLQINTSNYPEGIYNCALIKDNKISSLKKFNVIH